RICTRAALFLSLGAMAMYERDRAEGPGAGAERSTFTRKVARQWCSQQHAILCPGVRMQAGRCHGKGRALPDLVSSNPSNVTIRKLLSLPAYGCAVANRNAESRRPGTRLHAVCRQPRWQHFAEAVAG